MKFAAALLVLGRRRAPKLRNSFPISASPTMPSSRRTTALLALLPLLHYPAALADTLCLSRMLVLSPLAVALPRTTSLVASDYAATKALYESTHGIVWKYNKNWNMSNGDVCSWSDPNYSNRSGFKSPDDDQLNCIAGRVTYMCARILSCWHRPSRAYCALARSGPKSTTA